MNVREEKKHHSVILMLLRSLNILHEYLIKKNEKAHKGAGPFFFIGLRVHLQSNVQREAVNCAFFKLPFRYLCCYVICYHVTFFAICWLRKNSLFTVSSAAARLPVSFVPVALSEPQ